MEPMSAGERETAILGTGPAKLANFSDEKLSEFAGSFTEMLPLRDDGAARDNDHYWRCLLTYRLPHTFPCHGT